MTDELRSKPQPDQGFPDPSVHTPVGFDTGDPYATMNAANYKAIMDAAALKQSQIDAETIRQGGQGYQRLVDQNQQLFSTTLQQNQQLFNVSLNVLSNLALMSAKTLDKDTNEINSEGIGAAVAEGVQVGIAGQSAEIAAIVKAVVDGMAK